MNEKHTIYATVIIDDVEISDVPFKVEAVYSPSWPSSHDDPGSPEMYEVMQIRYDETSNKLDEAFAEYLLLDCDGRKQDAAIEAAEARRDALREMCPIPHFPALEVKA